ncbi:MAG TPA: transglycosylase family protein [Thermoleophilaceae bacterium]|nr:transglycosylase family protein [Thermoleophilaceae bacterium]
MLAVPAVLGLIAAPSALALPSDQTFSDAGTEGAAPPAGEAVPVASRHGQAKAPKTGRTPKPKVARVAVPPQLQAIAACESGGNPQAVDASGTYYGKYQFSMETWAGVGGSGSPAAASEAEQDRRAAMLYARSGAGQWPVCGQ